MVLQLIFELAPLLGGLHAEDWFFVSAYDSIVSRFIEIAKPSGSWSAVGR